MRTKRTPEPATINQTKTVKKTPTRTPAPPPRSTPAPAEPCLAGGKIWKMSGRNGVAFVHDAALAGELLQTDPKNLPKAAMAVYYDKKGRAFAWQIRFDTERWEEVTQRLVSPTPSG